MLRKILGLIGAVMVSSSMAWASDIRRVVTGLDANNKAVALFDSNVPLLSMRSPNPAGDMWVTEAYPADFNWSDDRAKTKVGLHPPKDGTIFRIVDFVPTTEKIDQLPWRFSSGQQR